MIDTPFFQYQLSWANTGQTVRVTRRLARKLRMIEQPQFEEFRAAVQQVHIAEARAAVVRFEGCAK